MVKITAVKKGERPKKLQQKKRRIINYNTFIRLPRERGYFPTDDPATYLEFIPAIRKFILQKLAERPYEERELMSKLKKYNPEFEYAWNYLDSEMLDEGQNSANCKSAFEKLIEGIEVRSKGNKNYWGLTSKLDTV
jgi:hypothetical protein